jgi:hypothetical protein
MTTVSFRPAQAAASRAKGLGAIAAMALVFLIGSEAMSDAQEAALPAPVAACASVEHRQFDFWIGEWDVTDAAGKPIGHNKIVRSDTGCWLSESWRGASGFTGNSLNAWDSQEKVWRQFWIGADGIPLRLAGGLKDNVMVMEGELPKAGGGVQLQRISWTPAADGSVAQKWDTSDDGGKSWQESFLGIYRKAMAK